MTPLVLTTKLGLKLLPVAAVSEAEMFALLVADTKAQHERFARQ